MRAFICVFLAAFSIFIPCWNRCGAVGDLGIDVERAGGPEGISQCPYCGRPIDVGRIHVDAEMIVRNQLQTALTDRDTGYVGGKGKTQYINVFIYRYEERQGGNFAVETPARVGFHMHLISKGTVRRTFVYEEDQQALMDNLLSVGKFIERGGKWVTVERLSSDGIKKGLDSLMEALE